MRRMLNKDLWLKAATSKAIWIGAAAYSLYWFLALVIPAGVLIEATTALMLIAGAAIVITWLPAFIEGIATGARIGSWQLPIAICITWLGLNETGAWRLFYRFGGMPEWMLNNHFTGQALWMTALSGLLYLLAPGNDTGEVPRRNWYLVISVVGIAGIMAGSVVTALLLSN
jgi:hypothetical protein